MDSGGNSQAPGDLVCKGSDRDLLGYMAKGSSHIVTLKSWPLWEFHPRFHQPLKDSIARGGGGGIDTTPAEVVASVSREVARDTQLPKSTAKRTELSSADDSNTQPKTLKHPTRKIQHGSTLFINAAFSADACPIMQRFCAKIFLLLYQ